MNTNNIIKTKKRKWNYFSVSNVGTHNSKKTAIFAAL